MELIIGMVVGSVVMGVCYSAFMMTEVQFSDYNSKRKEVNTIMELNTIISNDFFNYREAYFANNTVLLLCDTSKLEYEFSSTCILRKKNNVTDTFNIAASDVSVNYFSEEKESLIDELSFSAKVLGTNEKFHFSKIYGSETLIN